MSEEQEVRVTKVLARGLPIYLLAQTALLWLDYAVGSAGLRYGSHHVEALARLSGLGVLFALLISALCAPLLVVAGAVAAKRSRDGKGALGADALLRLWWGPRGAGVGPLVAFAAGSTLVAIGITLAARPLIMERTELPVAVAGTVGAAMAMAMAWLIYRVVVRRRPGLSTWHWGLSWWASGVAWWITAEALHEIDPLRLWPALLVLGVLLEAGALAWVLDRGAPRRPAMVAAAAVLAAGVVALAWPGGMTAYGQLAQHTSLGYPLMQVLRLAGDWDGDGSSTLFGGSDCAGADGEIYIEQLEVVGNGVDDNCLGGDLAAAPALPKTVEFPPVRRATERSSPPPNVIFITVDTLRADYIGKEIGGHPLTPNLDRLASSGAWFRRAYAPSTHTTESLPATMSGQYPSRWHQRTLYMGLDRTLAEVLGELGYERIALLTLPQAYHAVMVGFEDVDNRLGTVNRSKIAITAPSLTRNALERISQRQAPQRPLFLWVHYFEPHGHYVNHPNSPSWIEGETKKAHYAREVHAVDQWIGRLLEGLSAAGLLEGSLIAMFSDHGEGLGEQGLRWHVRSAAEPILRVPLILQGPGVPAGRQEETPVTLLDLFPTVIDSLGIEGTEARPGRSLLRLLRGEPWPLRPLFASTIYANTPLLWAVIQEDWKLVHDRQRELWSLHRLGPGLQESANQIEVEPEVAARLRHHLGIWRDENFNDAMIEARLERFPHRAPSRPPKLQGDISGVE